MNRLPIAVFGALVVATVGAFFVTQHIKIKTPLFTGERRSTAAFSPLHGGVCGRTDYRTVSFSFYLQHRSDDVGVYVIDKSGTIVRTLAASTHMRGGPHAVRRYFRWDGREDNHKIAPDGTYYYRIALLGQGRTIDETTLPISIKSTIPHPRVSNVSPPFATPGDAVTVSYSDYHRSGTVQIYRTDVPNWWLHRPFKLIGTKWRHTSVVWDGLIKNRPAPPGTYLVGFTMTDQACNAGVFPPRLPPAPGSTPHAGVTLRYLAAEPPTDPVAAGSRAVVLVDSRTRPYTWKLWRVGVRGALAHGAGNGHQFLARLPRKLGAGLYKVSLRSGTHRTAVPLVASATRSRSRAKLLVVLPALTWQGQNPVDDDGDGLPNTLDTGGPVTLARPYANGLPAGFDDVSAFLEYLDRAHLRYDLTTDVALADGVGPGLGAHGGVVFAGAERWLPGSMSALVRAFTQNGGNVLSLGVDSLRRGVTLHAGVASSPTAASTTDIFGARAGSVVARTPGLILVQHDGLGIFSTTSGIFSGYGFFQPFAPPAASASTPSSAAGASASTAAIIGFKSGRGTVVEVGLPGFGSSLAHNVNGQELVRQLWTVLGK